MPADISYADRIEMGNVAFGGTVNLPASSVQDENIEAGADIAASKLRHRHANDYRQKNGTDVVSETTLVHLGHAGGDLIAVRARVTTAPVGGDKTFTVDLQKAAEASGSWASVLSAPISFTGASDNTTKTGTITSVAYNATDAFRIVITASGTTGAQGQGLDVLSLFDERAA